MWIQLQAFHYPGQPAYQKTNQAFIDEWNNAIDMYDQIFSGITLVATTDNDSPTLPVQPSPSLRIRRGLRQQ